MESCVSVATQPIPIFPPTAAIPLRAMPLAPLSLALTAACRRISRAHPGLIRRLGEHDHCTFALDPTDLPVVLLLEPNGGVPRLRVMRGEVASDARISGPLAALIGLVHGAFDGDALFFSRDLVISGDTGAALALRNAVDDAELDLAEEFAAMTGPLAAPMRRLFAMVERRTGVALTRPEEAGTW